MGPNATSQSRAHTHTEGTTTPKWRIVQFAVVVVWATVTAAGSVASNWSQPVVVLLSKLLL